MSNEFYDYENTVKRQVEIIKDSIDRIEEVSKKSITDKAFIYKENYELKEKVDELEKQIEEYELDLNEFRLEIEHYKMLQCDLETKLEIKQKEIDFLTQTDEYLVDTQHRYNKIPWIIRKLFGAE